MKAEELSKGLRARRLRIAELRGNIERDQKELQALLDLDQGLDLPLQRRRAIDETTVAEVELLVAQGFSQRKAAQMLNISPASVCLIIKGTYSTALVAPKRRR